MIGPNEKKLTGDIYASDEELELLEDDEYLDLLSDACEIEETGENHADPELDALLAQYGF